MAIFSEHCTMCHLGVVFLFVLCCVLATTGANSQVNECLNKPGGRCISSKLPCGTNSTQSGYCCDKKQCCIDCNKDIECLAKPKGRCGSVCDQSNNEKQDGTCCGEQQVCCTFISAPCSPNPCINNGKCFIFFAGFFCSCPFPYSGQYCEIKPAGVR